MKWLSIGLLLASLGCITSKETTITSFSAPVLTPDVSSMNVDQRIRYALLRFNSFSINGNTAYPPAVSELIEIGEPALEPTLHFLVSSDSFTRLRAETAINGILMKNHGFESGKGWTTDNGEQAFRDFYRKFWDNKQGISEASFEDRVEFVRKIKVWLDSRKADRVKSGAEK